MSFHAGNYCRHDPPCQCTKGLLRRCGLVLSQVGRGGTDSPVPAPTEPRVVRDEDD